METALFLIGTILLAILVITVWNRKVAKYHALLDEPDFKAGYNAAVELYTLDKHTKRLKESHEIDIGRPCTAYAYGYACALADIESNERPEPWGTK